MRNRISGIVLVILLVIIGFQLATAENQMLYHPGIGEERNPWPEIHNSPIAKKIQQVWFTTQDGLRVNGCYVPARAGMPTAVFAHGNGGTMGGRLYILEAFVEKGYGFLAFDFQGFGVSEGTPSETGLYHDMTAASNFLNSKGIPVTRQIAVGESLGTAVVVEAASRLPYRAVVLLSALTSAPAVAESMRDHAKLWWLGFVPLSLIMRQHYDSLSRIQRVQAPLLIVHGARDEMMPVSMPKALIAKAGSHQKQLIILPDASHNTVFMVGRTQIMPALAKLLRESSH